MRVCARARILLLGSVLLLATDGARAQDRFDGLFRLAIADTDAGDAVRLIRAAGDVGMPVGIRVALSDLSRTDERLDAARLDQRPLWVAIPPPTTAADLEPWRTSVRRVIERAGERLTILEVDVSTQPADVARFALQLAATELRSARDQAFVAVGGTAMDILARREDVYTAAITPYVDLLVVGGSNRPDDEAWLQARDPDARLVATARVPSGGDPAHAVADALVAALGSITVAHLWPASDLTTDSLRALAALAPFVSPQVSATDPAVVGLSLRVGGAPAPPSLQSRLLFDARTFATLLYYRGAPAETAVTVSLRVPLGGAPVVIDLPSGNRIPAPGFTRDEATQQTTVTAPLTGRPTLINFNEGAEALGEVSSVSAERPLSVAEIISRHQRQQLAQDRLVRSYIADAQVRHFFRPTLTDPGYDIVTGNRYYVADDGIEWEELLFSVNNRRFRTRTPLPMLQPEKVFALPLQLRFDEGYTYRLEGTERIDGFDCYKVHFEPVRADATLYRGTVWIERRTFARIRVQAVHGGLPGMVISNDETHHYTPVGAVGNQPIFLLTRFTAREIVLLAGRNIPLEKNVTFSGFRINDDRFADERAAARRSDRVMYRETPNGLRPYVKREDTRVVVDTPTESVKAMALGVVIDPSYSFPLPIFGINYMDFRFRGDNQLALLFAGVLAAGNIQRPQLFGSPTLHASVDFFAIAAPSSDRVYTSSGEVESHRVLTWPLTSGLNLGWQATPFQKLSLQYQFRFDGYARDTTTAEGFRPPSSTITNGIGGQWEYSRGGYTVALNGAWFARARWAAWGDDTSGSAGVTPRRYVKYQASLSRDFLIDAFQKVNVNAAWFGGRDLDRFVKYQFGLFDTTRIHGVPAAVRFGELAMARGSYSVNVFDQFRLDLFLDQGWGRDGRGDDWQPIPGLGGAFNLPGPWNTIVRADVGRSWLPDRYGTLGSTSVQVMLLKPLP